MWYTRLPCVANRSPEQNTSGVGSLQHPARHRTTDPSRQKTERAFLCDMIYGFNFQIMIREER